MKYIDKMLDNYQKIELTKKEKDYLEAFDKNIADKLINETLTSLIKKMLKEELSPDFINGAKFSLYKFSKYFKD